MSLREKIVRQFGKPEGFVGVLAGHVMANRTSNRVRNRRTVDLMQLKPASRVLEIGCGPGLALCHCADVVTEGRIVGLDHSSVMINQARARLRRHGLSNRVELRVGRIEAGDRCGIFDRVYSLNVIQFVSDKQAFFGAVFDCLAVGGQCLTTYQPRLEYDHRGAADRMARALEAAMQSVGFEDIARIDLEAGHSEAICVLGLRAA